MTYTTVPPSFQAYVPEPDVDVQVRVREAPPIVYSVAEFGSVIVGLLTEITQILGFFFKFGKYEPREGILLIFDPEIVSASQIPFACSRILQFTFHVTRQKLSSMWYRKDSTQIDLSSSIWSLTDSSTPYTLAWRIIDQVQSYQPHKRTCNLCLAEKVAVINVKV